MKNEKVKKISKLNNMTIDRGQSLAQVSLAWVLRHNEITSALIGASKIEQIDDAVKEINNLSFIEEEINRIDGILK